MVVAAMPAPAHDIVDLPLTDHACLVLAALLVVVHEREKPPCRDFAHLTAAQATIAHDAR